MRFRRRRSFGVRIQPIVPAGGEEFDITRVMHGEDRVESKILWLRKFRPWRYFKCRENSIHAVWVFVIRHTNAAVEHFKERVMIAVFF